MIKFLIVRFSSIGDIVLTTPVIRCLKTRVKDARVYFLTKSGFAHVLDDNPYLTKIYKLDGNYQILLKELKEEKFDYIIDLHNNIRTKRLKFALKRMVYSLKKLNFQKWLLVNFKRNYLPEKHIVDRYLDTLNIFSVENDGKGLDYFIPEKDEVDILKRFGKEIRPYIAIVVGGGHNTKQIPADKLVEIIQRTNVSIVLLGGNEDRKKSELIHSSVRDKNVHNLTGELSLHQSASLIKNAGIVITPDTGMMHIASAFKKNILSVWGNTIPGFGMYPYKAGINSEIFEIDGLKCRPCSKIGFRTCPKKHFRCMQEQNYLQIINKAEKLISG